MITICKTLPSVLQRAHPIANAVTNMAISGGDVFLVVSATTVGRTYGHAVRLPA